MRLFILFVITMFAAPIFADTLDGGESALIVVIDTYQGDDTAACIQTAPCKTIGAGLLKVGPETRRFVINGRSFPCAQSKCSITNAR